MDTKKTVYRALPEAVTHPKKATHITTCEFTTIKKKQKIYEAPSLIDGHKGTNIWICDDESYRGYVLEIMFGAGEPVYAKSICTFTPTFGIDLIDGNIAQDIEESILEERFGRHTDRNAIYGGKPEVPILEYLAGRGIKGFTPQKSRANFSGSGPYYWTFGKLLLNSLLWLDHYA